MGIKVEGCEVGVRIRADAKPTYDNMVNNKIRICSGTTDVGIVLDPIIVIKMKNNNYAIKSARCNSTECVDHLCRR